MWGLRSASERIPSLKIPDLQIMVILFSFYILLIAPILYFIMKKKDKRDWNWVIIPIIAIVVTFSIYQLGFLHRSRNVIAHNVSYIELTENGQAELKATSAYFAPQAGDYTIRYKDVDMILPMNEYNYGQNQSNDTWVSIRPKYSEVQFKNVEFWSLRRVFIQKTITDAGFFESAVKLQDGKLVGTLTNNTKYNLRDVKLVLSGLTQELGTLAPGESTEVNMNFNHQYQISSNNGSFPTSRLIPNHMQGNQRYNEREQYMVEVLNMYRNNNIIYNTPVVVGWTEDSIFDTSINGKKHDEYNLALLKSNIKIIPSDDGYVYFPPGSFEAINTQSPVQASFVGDGYMMPSGVLEFKFNVKKEDIDYTIEKIHLNFWTNDGGRIDYKVYNWKTKEFEPLGTQLNWNTIEADKVNEYVSSNGILKTQISHSMNGHRHVGLPAISVEGKVNN